MPLTLPYNFTPGMLAASGQVMANFNAIVNYVNALAIPSTPISVANGGTGATNAPTALGNLGLSGQTIITGVATSSGKTITLTPAAGMPPISAYSTGLTLAFLAPAAITSNILIKLPGLAAAILFNTPIFTPTPSVVLNQLLFVTYSTALSGWVLVNTPPGSASGVLLSANNLSDVASTSTALSNIGGAALSLFTTGQVVGSAGSAPLPGGLVLKWGTVTVPSSAAHTSSVAVTFPAAFPTACFGATATPQGKADAAAGGYPACAANGYSAGGFTIILDTLGFDNITQTVPVFWWAVGN